MKNPDDFLQTLPARPGVYQMLNRQGDILYVGKARKLKNRLASYFHKGTQDPKTAALVKQIDDIRVIITDSENEALLLESNLIKKYKPRYNVLFRDDKTYPYLYLSTHDEFPRLVFYRGNRKLPGRYFGPYPSAFAVRESLNLLQKIFGIRQCSNSFFRNRTRPCLQYHIKRCTAPCVAYIDAPTYQQQVKYAELFLEGKNQQVIAELARLMEEASEKLEFERAAWYRDKIASMRKVQEQQHVSGEGGDADVLAVASQAGAACVHMVFIRAGRVMGNKVYFPKMQVAMGDEEILSSFLSQYYLQLEQHQQRDIPRQIIVNKALMDADWIEQVLVEQSQHPVNIAHSVRGERAAWLRLAINNAKQAIESHAANRMNVYRRFEALQEVLNLDNLPQRLECFDISHTQGEATVASCVVFDCMGPAKSAYRHFNITGIAPGDDYAAMRQALLRHYSHLKLEEHKLPDVLVIDGGKGQLHQAEQVLEELQIISITVIAIAKGVTRKPGLETIWIAGRDEPLDLAPDSEALHLIQHIRDEAHRFAITSHRKRRAKARSTSSLENIPGIGAKKRQELLRQFGGMQEVLRASVDELSKVPGISKALAQRIYSALHR